jgi:hypothetical protein
MEDAKSTNGNGKELRIEPFRPQSGKDQKSAVRTDVKKLVPKKATPSKDKPAELLRKKATGKSKSDKLVCRYCGSDDLAPSFIKRRDRRCRKCFSKRYRSVVRAKAKAKR